MDLESNSEQLFIIKEENEVIEIRPLKNEDCDIVESFSIHYLFRLLTSKINDVKVDISRIAILNLSHCNLTELPESCKKLNLKHLDLSRNNLTNAPLCLYNGLKYLEFLDLSYNKIRYFDMEPDCLPFIKVILLNNNNFENIPKWFLTFRCTNIEQFDYSHNKAENYKYLKNSFNLNFIKLKKLVLKNSCLIDSDYNLLKSFKSLTYLDISNESDDRFINKFKDLDDLFVKPRWQELHILTLQNLLVPLFPEGIAWIETLTELYLTNNFLSWIPDDVQFLVNLEILDISNNEIVAIPSNIVSLKKLAALHASDNSIETVPDFSVMCSLNTLDLYNNFLDEFSCNLDNFDFVDIEDNYFDSKSIEDYSAYEEKKNHLRDKFVCLRYNGPKSVPNKYSSSSSSSDSEGYYGDIGCKTAYSNYISVDETENWDLPGMARTRNPEIDSVDDNWQDDTDTLFEPIKKHKIYVNDEDWMFVDFEES